MICFNVGYDFLYHFRSPVCSVGIAASHKSSDICFQFITEGELDIVATVSQLFGVVSFGCTFLMAFYVDDATIDINSDRCQIAFRKQFSKDFEINVSQHLGCLEGEVS